MKKNKYNLQVGDKIKHKYGNYTIQAISKEGVLLVANGNYDTWEFVNSSLYNGSYTIIERAKKEFPKKWSVFSGFDGELKIFISQFEAKGFMSLWNGNATARYYNFDGRLINNFSEKPDYEVVTLDQLREHYLNTKQTMKEESKKRNYWL